MKKIILNSVLSVLTLSSVMACQNEDILSRVQTLENNNNVVKAKSIIAPANISEIPNKTVLKDLNSAVIVSTVSSNKLEDKNDKQKLLFSITNNINSITKSTPLPQLANVETFGLKKDRHGLTEKQYQQEVLEIKNAIKGKKIKANKKAFTNSLPSEGSTRTFLLNNRENNTVSKRTVVLKKLSKSAYFWVAQDEVNDIDETVFENTVQYWDETAYPLVTSKFGEAPTPPRDIDGENRIHIYIDTISANKGLYGYFSPMDVVTEKGNKADMLYINSWMLKKGTSNEHSAKSTLIHEFQHLVNFNNKVVQKYLDGKQPLMEGRWLNEGMSTYAEQLGGLGLPSGDTFTALYLNHFFENPSAVPVVTDDPNLNYGAVYLLVLYLVEQYGEESLKTLTMSDKINTENVELITKAPFKKTFTDWATALLLSGSGKDPKFDFKTVDLHKTYGDITLDGINLSNVINKFPLQGSLELNNWSINYVKLDGINNTSLNLTVKNQGKANLGTNLIKLN